MTRTSVLRRCFFGGLSLLGAAAALAQATPVATPEPAPMAMLAGNGETPAPALAPVAGSGKRLDHTYTFQIVLLMADNAMPAVTENVPAKAQRALKDLQDFLPYKSYHLVDMAWLRTSRDASSQITGPKGESYVIDLSVGPSGGPGERLLVQEFRITQVAMMPPPGAAQFGSPRRSANCSRARSGWSSARPWWSARQMAAAKPASCLGGAKARRRSARGIFARRFGYEDPAPPLAAQDSGYRTARPLLAGWSAAWRVGTPATVKIDPSAGASATHSIEVVERTGAGRRTSQGRIGAGRDGVSARRAGSRSGRSGLSGARIPSVTLHVEPAAALPELRSGDAVLRVTAERAGTWLRSLPPAVEELRMPVRLQPPSLQVTSNHVYVAQGGCEAVVYRVGDGSARDGVRAGDWFFPGAVLPGGDAHARFALFAVPYDMADASGVRLIAEDDVGNEAQVAFIEVLPRPFGTESIQLDDAYLQRVVPAIMAGRRISRTWARRWQTICRSIAICGGSTA